MANDSDHLAEAEAAKAQEQDALRELAKARLEIERLRNSVERYCKMIIEMGTDGLFLGDNPTLITVAETIYSAHMQVKNGTAVRSSNPPDTDTVPVDVREITKSEHGIMQTALRKSVRLVKAVPVKELIAKAAEHWANIAAGEEADTGPCGLCRHFKGLCSVSEDGKMLTQPCPIYEATNLYGCKGTPFEAWIKAAGDRFSTRYSEGGLWADTDELREAAGAMAKFLGDLLRRY